MLVKIQSRSTRSGQGGLALYIPWRKEGDVSGVERRSMRSGEVIVGGMVVW